MIAALASVASAAQVEIGPHAGAVTNDPDLRRYLVGASVAVQPDDVLAVELRGTWSPTLGELDYKLPVKQIVTYVDEPRQLSRLRGVATASLRFTPIAGRVAVQPDVVADFALYGAVGTGVVETRDDLPALMKTEDPAALATETQLHPAIEVGVGLRVAPSPWVALRLEWRRLAYVEVFEATDLVTTTPASVLGGVSFLLPPRADVDR